MIYCCSAWGCCSESKVNTLQKIQNRAARIVTSSPYYASAAPIIQDLGWSTIKDLIRKETATLTYKSLNLVAPDYLRKMFFKCSKTRKRVLRSSDTDLKIPVLNTISDQKAFSYRGARLWNGLEMQTKQSASLKTFKDQL